MNLIAKRRGLAFAQYCGLTLFFVGWMIAMFSTTTTGAYLMGAGLFIFVGHTPKNKLKRWAKMDF